MFRRRKYLVKAGLQFRYIGAILGTVFVIAAVCITTTYFNLLVLLGEKLANVYPQGRLMITLQEVNLVAFYRVLILIPFVALVGLLLSHRIAGPVFRIEKVLKDVGKGNLNVSLQLRKKDELKSMADTINDMTAALRETEKSNQKLIREVSSVSSNIKSLLSKEPIDKQAISKEIDSIIQKTT